MAEAQTIIEGIKHETRNVFEERKDVLSTKEDVLNLRNELKSEIAELRLDVERGFKDNLKWTIAPMLVIAGLIIAAMKFL